MTPSQLILILTVLLCPSLAMAQQQAGPAAKGRALTAEVKLVGEGWTLLGKGDLAGAADRAAAAAKASPRGIAALTLGLEVAIARTHARAGLDYYEAWLGKRTMEEPAVVRRVADAVLREEAASTEELDRHLALTLLMEAGDEWARTALETTATSSGAAARALASSGSDAGVAILLEQLKSGGGVVRTIEALGKSRSPRAAAPLGAYLGDPRPEVRGTAAEALGRIQGRDAVERLRPLLSDQSSFVRVKAAAALLSADDPAGMAVLQEVLASSADSAAGRLIVAEAMSSQQDEKWLALVRELTAAAEADVRLGAARLIAPHDPALAASVLEELSGSNNPAIREQAGRWLAGEVEGDLGALRRFLRNSDGPTRVGAAARILELTR